MGTLVSKDTSGSFVHPQGLPEAVSRRTRTAKVWLKEPTSDGRERGDIACSGGPIHYREDPFSEVEQYKEIDLEVQLTPDEDWDFACETAGYQVRFWQSRVYSGKTFRYIAQFRRTGKWLAMAPVALVWQNDAGDRELKSRPKAVGAPEIDNERGQVLWRDVFGPGLHFQYSLCPSRFFKTLIVTNKNDLPAPTVGGPGLQLILVMALSWHGQSKAANRFAKNIEPIEPTDDLSVADDFPDEGLLNPEVFSFRDEFDRDTWWMRKPRAWDSAPERHYIDVNWRLRRKGNFVFALLSVRAQAFAHPDAVYPVYIDTDMAEEQVAAGNCDCHTYSTTLNPDGDYIWVDHNAGDLHGYFRFTPPIPQGATVSPAYIDMRADATCNWAADLRIIGIKETNTAVWSTQTDADGRAVTTAYVDWTTGNWAVDSWYGQTNDAQDIKAIIEEIVGQGGWVSGNGLAIKVYALSRGDAPRPVCAYEHDPDGTLSAKFNCSYTVAANGNGVFSRAARRRRLVGSRIV